MEEKIPISQNLWSYLSENQQNLIREGYYLMNNIIQDNAYQFKDYAFLVFPFAKAYEGYLKQLFKDIGFISHLDYISDHLRLGKLLSPNLIGRLGERSLYKKILDNSSKDLADQVWQTWKVGRNQVFHYYPHNLRALNFNDAKELIGQIIKTMEVLYEKFQNQIKNNKVNKSY